MKTRMVLLASAAAAIAAAGPASALVAAPSLSLTTTKAASGSGGNGSTSGIHDTTKSDRQYCNSDQSQWIEYRGPKDIWPPNHKMRDYTIVAHDDNGGTVTLMTTVMSSQLPNGPGDGNTDTDYVDNTPAGADMGEGEAENTGQVRGERSGTDKAGRTYTFDSHAMFGSDGSSCDKTFTAHVPHDQRDQTNTKKNRTARRR